MKFDEAMRKRKTKKHRSEILADLNLCTASDIIQILNGGTIESPRREKQHRVDDVTKRKIAEEYFRGGITQNDLSEKYDVAKGTVSKSIKEYKRSKSPQRDPVSSNKKNESKREESVVADAAWSLVGKMTETISTFAEQLEQEYADYGDFSLYKNGRAFGIKIKKQGLNFELQKQYGEKGDV